MPDNPEISQTVEQPKLGCLYGGIIAILRIIYHNSPEKLEKVDTLAEYIAHQPKN